jgi:hypothetical protein
MFAFIHLLCCIYFVVMSQVLPSFSVGKNCPGQPPQTKLWCLSLTHPMLQAFICFVSSSHSFLFLEKNRALPCTPFSFFLENRATLPHPKLTFCDVYVFSHTPMLHSFICYVAFYFVVISQACPVFSVGKNYPGQTVMFIPHSPHVASIHLFCFKLTQFSLFFQRRQTSA